MVIILASFITLLRMFFAGRSLWLDEGMLAWSFTQRSFADLVSAPLEKMQSAPVLYLYIVKIITLIFGNNEFTLRIFSILCYCITLGLTYCLSKNLKYPLAVCAFVASNARILRYSNEFKPYISDCMAVILVLFLYKRYREGKLSVGWLTASFVALIWFSNPTCFFISAILIYEFFRTPKKILLPGLLCLISFGLYFIFWLHPVIDQGDMQEWWTGRYFPLIPTSIEDLKTIKTMFLELSRHVAKPDLGITLFACFAFVKNIIKEKDPVIFMIFAGVFVALVASYLTCYPVEVRLWLFVYPLVAYLAFYFIDSLDKSTAILAFTFVFCTMGFQNYLKRENLFYPREELNPIIEYVEDKDDFIYVYLTAVPTFCYKNNYEIGDNVFLGTDTFLKYNPDLEKIKKHDKGYIVISHHDGNKVDGLFADLKENDYNVSVEMEVHLTKLYYFEKQSFQ